MHVLNYTVLRAINFNPTSIVHKIPNALVYDAEFSDAVR